MDSAEFRRLGHLLIDRIADYHDRVGDEPVLSRVAPGEVAAGVAAHAPERGESWDVILADFERVVMPGITHWQSPNFFGFFPANASYPAILGDLMSTGLGVQGMLWATSPACTEIETRVLDWMGEMIGLPREFLSAGGTGVGGGGGGGGGGGVIQGTASEATLVALLAARKRAAGGGAKGVVYTSTQAHSSVVKAAMIAGFADGPEDRRRVRLIGTDRAYAMRADLLRAAMQADRAAGLTPMYVCATVGTTSSTAVDPIAEIGALCPDMGVWLHVDAAFSGAACICPEFRGAIAGIERADSFCFNPHKWLLTNFDCSLLWTRDRTALTGALSVTPEYLRNAASSSGAVIDYRDWQIPLGRRFRALKLWWVVRHYGVEGLRAYIREHVRLAAAFEELVQGDSRFEVVTERTSALVCFRLRPRVGESPQQTDARNAALLGRINASGRAYLTHTVLPGFDGSDGGEPVPARYVLRMALGGAKTQERHVREAWTLIGTAVED